MLDVKVASTITRVAMEFEEGDRNSCVPDQRLRETKPSFDLNKRQGKVRYLTKSTDLGAEGLTIRQVALSW